MATLSLKPSHKAVVRLDDEQYIVRLIGQVTTVSLETQKLVKGLPEMRFEKGD